jgi:hypothetical protein
METPGYGPARTTVSTATTILASPERSFSQRRDVPVLAAGNPPEAIERFRNTRSNIEGMG